MTPPPAVARRERSLAELADRSWDVLIVGGGITGIATLLEATERGLSAALIERDDLCVGTSSRSSKLIHGGLRYLEQFQFRLVRQALVERSRFVRDVPHLVHVEPFLVPVHGSVLSMPYIGAGLAVYDLFGATAGGGRTNVLRPSSVMRHSPSVRRPGLRGGFIYHDAVMDDVRVAIALLRTALRLGATAVTRVEATGFRAATDGAVVSACDRQSGRGIEISARMVVDATGPADGFGRAGATSALQDQTVLRSRGTHIIIDRSAIPSDMGMTLRVPGRVVFVIPWHGQWLVGTTDVAHEGDVQSPQSTPDEVNYLLDTLRRALDLDLDHSAIVATFAGIRPLAAPRSGISSVKASREHRIDRPEPAMLRIRGGKYTTARLMAAEAIDTIAARSRGPRQPAPIAGALGADEHEAFATGLAHRFALDQALVDGVIDRHGRDAEHVLELGEKMNLLRPISADADVIEAEVPWAAREELAASVDDVLARRSRIALLRRDHGLSGAARVAELLAPELGWSAASAAKSVSDYQASAIREYGLPASLPAA